MFTGFRMVFIVHSEKHLDLSDVSRKLKELNRFLLGRRPQHHAPHLFNHSVPSTD